MSVLLTHEGVSRDTVVVMETRRDNRAHASSARDIYNPIKSNKHVVTKCNMLAL